MSRWPKETSSWSGRATRGGWTRRAVGHGQREGRPSSDRRPFPGRSRVVRLGSDGNSDTAPSSTEGVDFPIHALALNAMGVHLLDYLYLEDLGRPASVPGDGSSCSSAPRSASREAPAPPSTRSQSSDDTSRQ